MKINWIPGKDRSGALADIPRTVWALGLVSLFMDISSEMIHSLLPVFLVSVLGASAVSVGIIEGVAEAAAYLVKIFSGALSDRLGRRKALAVVGYGLGALTKPLFAAAAGVGLVFTARVVDRLGKGIRGAPRDALIADITRPHQRGTSYGLRQSLDTTGAFLGPLLAFACMAVTHDNYRTVFWLAVLPGLVSVLILILAVREPASSGEKRSSSPIKWRDFSTLSTTYWLVVVCGWLFALARFSEAFLLLRAGSVGMPPHAIPLILVLMNVVYSLTAYPAGKLSDKIGRSKLLTAGLGALFFSDLVLAFADTVWHAVIGTLLWGLHMGLTQGLFSALVADTAPRNLRGTAFGLFNLFSGVAVLAASLIAGMLWGRFGPPATFLCGAALSALTAIVFILVKGRIGFARGPRTA